MKLLKIISIIVLILMTTVGVAHAFVFPQQSRCILIDFYDFEKEENLYFRAGLEETQKQELLRTIQQAEARVALFWGEKTAQPKYIYCDNAADYQKFGLPFPTPAVAHMKFGAYVVISKDGLDLDIIAHEISHTELFTRIGFFNREFKIPTWFDEGLAMQVDHRSYYSIDSLKSKSVDFKNLPEVTQMNRPAQFNMGTRDAVMLNYSTAKYELYQWYTPEKLEAFIKAINNGKNFEDAF